MPIRQLTPEQVAYHRGAQAEREQCARILDALAAGKRGVAAEYRKAGSEWTAGYADMEAELFESAAQKIRARK